MILIILIIFLILITYIIYFNINSNNNTNNIEDFISPTFDYENNGHNKICPDYLTTNGSYYYLVNNDDPSRLETYETLKEAQTKLKELGCPNYNPISLVKVNVVNNDPSVSIDRKCATSTAINQFLEDAYTYSINDNNKTAENLNPDLDIDTIQSKVPEYLKEYNNSLADFLGDKKPSDDVTREEIKNIISNYIQNASPDELVNYSQSLCMINEYVNDNNGIKSNNNAGSFYDNYISINDIENRIYTLEPVKMKLNKVTGKKTIYKGEHLANPELIEKDGDAITVDEEIIMELVRIPGKTYTEDALNNKRDVVYPLMNEVWTLNEPITNIMMNKMFSA